jgi:CRP-like cAMP-binding protein
VPVEVCDQGRAGGWTLRPPFGWSARRCDTGPDDATSARITRLTIATTTNSTISKYTIAITASCRPCLPSVRVAVPRVCRPGDTGTVTGATFIGRLVGAAMGVNRGFTTAGCYRIAATGDPTVASGAGGSAVKWQLLDSLSDVDRQAVLSRCHRQRYPRGAFICHQGEAGDSVHLIASGTVAIRVNGPVGDVITVDVMRPGNSFGEQALINDGAVRSATVVALERVETLRLTRDEFRSLWEEHPGASMVVAKMLEARLRSTSQALLDALHLPATTRVMRRLAYLADIYAGHSTQSIPLTQDDIASMAGTTRQTVNRILNLASDEGLVELNRGRIVILDPAGVARRAGSAR